MLGIKEIVKEAESLPVEERAIVVDSLLRTLNPPDSEVDRRWAMVAKRRLTELRIGQVQPVPDDEVFARIKTAGITRQRLEHSSPNIYEFPF